MPIRRAASRPVTSGALSVADALTLAAALALCAFALVLSTNVAALAWSVVALAVTLVYPLSKRVFAMILSRRTLISSSLQKKLEKSWTHSK